MAKKRRENRKANDRKETQKEKKRKAYGEIKEKGERKERPMVKIERKVREKK